MIISRILIAIHYMGLYDSLHENDIHERKDLTSDKQHILDYMSSDELAAGEGQ